MKILHQNNIGFAISETGEITCSSTWELMADSIDDWVDFAATARDWKKAGDNWIVPDDDSEGFTDDADYVITGVDLTAKSRWVYDVSLKGRKRDVTARMIDYSETINNKDECEKTATWSIDAESLDGFLPEIGAVMTWAGTYYYCDNINTKKAGIAEGRYEVTITAIDLSTVMLGNPSFSRNDKYESQKSATWKVSNAAYEAFIEAHDVNSDASNWAGAGYYVTSIKADPRGKLGYDVSVEAKHIGVRCLDINQDTNFKGFASSSGDNASEIKYTGKWQVHKDNAGDFDNLAGASADDWAAAGFIISRVSRSQVSDVEYEYTLEAYNPDDISTPANLGQLNDDRSKLSNRMDMEVKCLEFTLSARQAGWMKEKPNKTGSTKEVTDKNVSEILKPIIQSAMYNSLDTEELRAIEWTPSRDCPIILPTGSQYADKKWIDKPFTCIAVEHTLYSQGDIAKQLAQLEARRDKIPYIQYGKISGLLKSWKRINYNVEKIFDNKGAPWWKESYTLMACPHAWKWNPTYHEGQG